MNKLIENLIGIVISIALIGIMMLGISFIASTDLATNVKDVLVFILWAVISVSVISLWVDWDK